MGLLARVIVEDFYTLPAILWPNCPMDRERAERRQGSDSQIENLTPALGTPNSCQLAQGQSVWPLQTGTTTRLRITFCKANAFPTFHGSLVNGDRSWDAPLLLPMVRATFVYISAPIGVPSSHRCLFPSPLLVCLVYRRSMVMNNTLTQGRGNTFTKWLRTHNLAVVLFCARGGPPTIVDN